VTVLLSLLQRVPVVVHGVHDVAVLVFWAAVAVLVGVWLVGWLILTVAGLVVAAVVAHYFLTLPR
jgi:hypothetical protein